MVNTTLFINQSDVVQIGAAINTESAGIFGLGILIASYLIFFFTLLRWGIRPAFATSSFIGATFAILMRLMGWINDPVLYGAFIVAIIAVLVLWFSRDG